MKKMNSFANGSFAILEIIFEQNGVSFEDKLDCVIFSAILGQELKFGYIDFVDKWMLGT